MRGDDLAGRDARQRELRRRGRLRAPAGAVRGVHGVLARALLMKTELSLLGLTGALVSVGPTGGLREWTGPSNSV